MREQTPLDEDRATDEEGREFIARRHRFPANGPGFLITPILWFAYFLVVYSVQGAACVGGLLDAAATRLIVGLLTLATAAAIVVLGVWSYRAWRDLLRALEEEERQRPGHSAFLAYGALLHAGLFLVATLWIGVPPLFLDPCGS